ncbi:zinc-dependent metalloprotease [Pseudoxanthomonas putridarboris]|uniref:Zinc-dependent metalloprotease n=1 Tax=Pseudoxanthomonas putridarboris TaxID=752605 RepID=A0ABU9IVL9_9GAMM
MKLISASHLASVYVLLLVVGFPAKAIDNAPRDNQQKPDGQVQGPEEFWEIEVSDKNVSFNLLPSDLDQDYVVWKLPSTGKAAPWQLIRWSKEGDSIVLRSTAGRDAELSSDWETGAAVVAKFPARSLVNGRYQVNVTRLFRAAYPSGWGHEEVSASIALRFDPPKMFPRNAVLTTSRRHARSSVEASMRWNFVRLPGIRMETKKLLPRSAFMHPGFLEAWPFGDIKDGQQEVVQRWRIDGQKLSGEAAKQASSIVVYLAPSTPERWKPWVKKGVESWNEAFLAAGLGTPIAAVDALSVGGWDYDDLRNSALCWGEREACGWNIFDPRTGEILQAQIHSTDQSLPSLLPRYLVNMAALDPRAAEETLPDDLLGSLVRQVAAHEIGHLLGLKDGTYGTFSYSTEQLRDRSWLESNRFSPSIMNYARFNYVAQPEDNVPVPSLLQGIGSADRFWIRWGYSKSDSSAELDALWNSKSLYRYRRTDSRVKGPYDGIETPGVSDPVAGAQLGWKNVERSIALISNREISSSDPDIAELVGPKALYDAAFQQWVNMNRQVVSLIGGKMLDPSLNSIGEPESVRESGVSLVPSDQQRAAIRHLCTGFFKKVPDLLVKGNFLRRSGLTTSAAEEKIRLAREQMYGLSIAERSRIEVLRDVGTNRPNAERDFGTYDLLRELRECVVR